MGPMGPPHKLYASGASGTIMRVPRNSYMRQGSLEQLYGPPGPFRPIGTVVWSSQFFIAIVICEQYVTWCIGRIPRTNVPNTWTWYEHNTRIHPTPPDEPPWRSAEFARKLIKFVISERFFGFSLLWALGGFRIMQNIRGRQTKMLPARQTECCLSWFGQNCRFLILRI